MAYTLKLSYFSIAFVVFYFIFPTAFNISTGHSHFKPFYCCLLILFLAGSLVNITAKYADKNIHLAWTVPVQKQCREINKFEIRWNNILKPTECHGEKLIQVKSCQRYSKDILYFSCFYILDSHVESMHKLFNPLIFNGCSCIRLSASLFSYKVTFLNNWPVAVSVVHTTDSWPYVTNDNVAMLGKFQLKHQIRFTSCVSRLSVAEWSLLTLLNTLPDMSFKVRTRSGTCSRAVSLVQYALFYKIIPFFEETWLDFITHPNTIFNYNFWLLHVFPSLSFQSVYIIFSFLRLIDINTILLMTL